MKPDAPSQPRRFYKTAHVEPVDNGFAVQLDGRPVRSPKGAALAVPKRALADKIAAEWAGQGDTLDLIGMGLTRLAHTALDLEPAAAEALAAEQARFAGSDLLCYREAAHSGLAAEEALAWDPWLQWAERELQAPLHPVSGIIHRPQPENSLQRVQALAAELDPFALTGLGYATALFGSAVLAFAVQRGALDAAEAYELSRLDEAWQETRWGEDAEAAARTAGRRRDARLIGDWFTALRT
jgi:chaperone required for assembly of F1-ATPase